MTRLPTQFLLLWTVFQIPGSAQDSSGVAVTGMVLDPQRAGVLGAKVTLKRAGSDEARTTNADDSGAFRFGGVAPANYEVRVEQNGFKPYVSRLRVGNQSPRSMNIVLALADVQEQVTVGDQLTQVSTNTSDNLDTVTMNRSALDNLPILTRTILRPCPGFWMRVLSERTV